MPLEIKISDVCKSYGALPVLRDVSFEVGSRETFAIIGPNGAGKTTLFKVITGEVFANSGHIEFCGKDISRLSARERVRIGFGRTFQVARIYPDFSTLENVLFAIEARERARWSTLRNVFRIRPTSEARREAADVVASVGLTSKMNEGAWSLAYGDKKRLEFAVTLALRPRILVLDEPTAGMSPSDRHQIVELIRRLRTEGNLTILLTEHDMDVVFGLADQIMVLNLGEVIATGSIDEVRANPVVGQIYLGSEAGHA